MPTAASATSSGYSNRRMPRRAMYSWLITRTAAAEIRIATLANRENASSMNMPWKATRVSELPSPIHRARNSISAPVAQTMSEASRSLPE